jgi:hypothetical protein
MYTLKKKARRKIASISIWGTTYIHLRNPYIIALWSVTFPGFGHLLVHKYIRGYLLVVWEIFINQISNLNFAMYYSLIGDMDSAKDVLNVNYVYMYIPLYLYAIWDSYRSCVELNNLYVLAEKDQLPITALTVTPLEINYLDKRSPLLACLWSASIPSTGHLYLHQFISAFFTLVITIIIIHFSHFFEGIHYLLLGDFQKSTEVLNKQWAFYLPSLYFYGIYESYVNAVENNKLYKAEQKMFFQKNYQKKDFRVKGTKVR